MLNAHLARGAISVVVATNAETSIGSVEKHDGSAFWSGRIGTFSIGFTVLGLAHVGFSIAGKTMSTVRVHLARNASSDGGALFDKAGAGEGVGAVIGGLASGSAHAHFASHVVTTVGVRQALDTLLGSGVTRSPAGSGTLRTGSACWGGTSTIDTVSKRTVSVIFALDAFLAGAETVVTENAETIHIGDTCAGSTDASGNTGAHKARVARRTVGVNLTQGALTCNAGIPKSRKREAVDRLGQSVSSAFRVSVTE